MNEPIYVNRLEVIDHTDPTPMDFDRGRVLVKWGDLPFKVEYSLQDEGRTLKVFISKE